MVKEEKGEPTKKAAQGVRELRQGGCEDEEVQRLQAGPVLLRRVPAERLEVAQEVVQGSGGAEEGGREGIGCHPFEPSEREADVGEAGLGVWSERTSEKGGKGKEGRREEIGAKVGEKTPLTSLVGRGEAGRSGQ